MTRKHFIALARALRSTMVDRPADFGDFGDPNPQRKAYQTWLFTVYAVADACRQANASFDRGRFYFACGVPTVDAHVLNLAPGRGGVAGARREAADLAR